MQRQPHIRGRDGKRGGHGQLLCDLGSGRAWFPSGLPTPAAVSGTAVTEIFVPGYDAAAAMQVKLPLPGQVWANQAGL